MRQEDFESVAASAFENTGTVITVFVRYQDCGEIVENQIEAGQACCQFARTEAAIKQHFRATRLDDQRIAAAAAAERGKTQALSPFSPAQTQLERIIPIRQAEPRDLRQMIAGQPGIAGTHCQLRVVA